MFHSDEAEGGTEGIAVVHVRDDAVDEFHALYTATAEQPEPAATVTPDEQAAATAWCEAWGTEDADLVIPLAADDLVITAGGADSGFVGTGVDGIQQAMSSLQADPEDRVECASPSIGNGGWIATAQQFVDDETGNTWGGVIAVQLTADGLVSAQTHLMDVIDADGNPIDVSQLPSGEIIDSEGNVVDE